MGIAENMLSDKIIDLKKLTETSPKLFDNKLF